MHCQSSDTRHGTAAGAVHPSPDSTTLPVTADLLEVLTDEINLAHREAQDYAGKAIERALQAGDMLLTVKARLPHGEFGPWCATNLPDISQRTLQKYMRVARELPAEKRAGSHLGLNETLRMIAKSDDTPDSPETTSLTPYLPEPRCMAVLTEGSKTWYIAKSIKYPGYYYFMEELELVDGSATVEYTSRPVKVDLLRHKLEKCYAGNVLLIDRTDWIQIEDGDRRLQKVIDTWNRIDRAREWGKKNVMDGEKWGGAQ